MKRLPAYPLSIGMSAIDGLAVSTVITTSLVYQVETVGLNPLQLILVGTVLEATIFAFEIPTGVVADVYSRRLSVVIGLVLTGAGFLLAGSIPLFGALLAASVVGGLGATFLSGARTAWLADEIGTERLPQALMRGSQASLVGGLAGLIFGVGGSFVFGELGGLRTELVPLSLPLAFGASAAVGIFFGYYPATQAAQLDRADGRQRRRPGEPAGRGDRRR